MDNVSYVIILKYIFNLKNYYLVDGIYTKREGFSAPHRGTRYQLSKWRDGLQPSKEYFNMKHASTKKTL